MLNLRQYSRMEDCAERLKKAIHIGDASDLYDMMAKIDAMYSEEIPKIKDLYEEVGQQGGLAKRHAKSIHACLKKYMEDNYNPLNKELLSEVHALLSQYSDAYPLYQSALSKYENGGDLRNALDDLRLSFELLIKKIFNNSKSLENNKDELGQFLKEKNISSEVRNMFEKLMNCLTKYQNNYIKHSDGVLENEVQFIIELSSVMMKFVMNTVKEESAHE